MILCPIGHGHWVSHDGTRRFPPDTRCVAEARAFVRAALEPKVPRDALDEIEVVVSELVTNAVVHVRQPVELTIDANGSVRVEVVDESPDQPEARAPQSTETSGRGMHIVEQFCDRWGVHVRDGGKCVWCEIDLDAPT